LSPLQLTISPLYKYRFGFASVITHAEFWYTVVELSFALTPMQSGGLV